MQRLHDQCVVMLSQDSFYRGLTPEESANAAGMLVCCTTAVASASQAVTDIWHIWQWFRHLSTDSAGSEATRAALHLPVILCSY